MSKQNRRRILINQEFTPSFVPNIIIGGMGTNITNVGDLLISFNMGAHVSDEFEIDPATYDIYARLDNSQNSDITQANWGAQSRLSYFNDIGGIIKELKVAGFKSSGNCVSYKFPGVTLCEANVFENNLSLNEVELPLSTLGAKGDDSIFLNCQANGNGTFNANTLTVNLGNRDGDIVYLEDTKKWINTYI